MEYLITILIIFCFVLLEGFFSGSEHGLVVSDKSKLRHQARQGSKTAKLVLKMFRKPEWILSTTLTGTSLAMVTGSTISAALMLQLFPKFGDLLTIFVLTPFTLFFGEVVAKNLFHQKSNIFATRVIYPIYWCSWLFLPIRVVLSFAASGISRLLGVKTWTESLSLTKEELQLHLDMAKEGGDVKQQERHIVHRGPRGCKQESRGHHLRLYYLRHKCPGRRQRRGPRRR